MKRPLANVPASVHARLLAGAKSRQEDFNLTLRRYVAERFLFRLGASSHRGQFLLKGAMLFALWGGGLYRPTRDLDLTGYAQADPGHLAAIVGEICRIPCEPDGLAFLPDSIAAEPIRHHEAYQGFRLTIQVALGQARVQLQVDVGLGDVVHPAAVEVEYPTLLDGPAPRVFAYPREAVVAEKLHAMVLHGELNTRLKDIRDVCTLSQHFAFAGADLAAAIRATFGRRTTARLEGEPTALTAAFYEAPGRRSAWRQYLRRESPPEPHADFEDVGTQVRSFLGPVWRALVLAEAFPQHWPARGPWRPT